MRLDSITLSLSCVVSANCTLVSFNSASHVCLLAFSSSLSSRRFCNCASNSTLSSVFWISNFSFNLLQVVP
ncbi:hypothetical protein BDN72DRAFT_292996 [Pluteus cervinus]|uniref:Uncharacterized protein n=1 Tax=Pluteus cervinus TaxID=181527 RepID=A0ACD3AET9_9AGAR|nr:hypothetical protein BDN72DRAFT_292996 [Pluteus cervinus]